MLDPALSVSCGGPCRHAFGVTRVGPVSVVRWLDGGGDLVNTTVGGLLRGPDRYDICVWDRFSLMVIGRPSGMLRGPSRVGFPITLRSVDCMHWSAVL